MNVVYVLGAGTSSYAGIPMLNAFLHTARQQFFGGDIEKDTAEYQWYESVFRHVASFESCGRFVNFDFHNLEEVFGLIDMADALDDRGIDPNFPTLPCFKKMIRSVIQRASVNIGSATSFDSYVQFIEGYLRKKPATTVLTFNYDEVLQSMPEPTKPSGVRYDWNDWITKRETNGIRILKLHGSIGWGGEIPTIIPPTWSKSLRDEDARETLIPIWTRARKALAQAERIVFIGYSLPWTDQYFRQFLAFALADNKMLRRVVVIDPSHAVDERFRAMLNEHFRRDYQYFDLKFEAMFSQHVMAFSQEYPGGEQEFAKQVNACRKALQL